MKDQDKTRAQLISEFEEVRGRLEDMDRRELLLQTLLRHMDAAVIIHDSDTRILTINSKAQTLFDLEEGQIVEKLADEVHWNFLRPDGGALPVEAHPVRRVLRNKQPLKNLMAGVYRPDQADIRWVVINAEPVLDHQGQIQQVIITYVDITEGKWAEEALRESEALYRSIVEQACEGIVLIDLITKQLLESNPSYQKMLGYTAQEIRRLTLYDIVAHNRQSIDAFLERAQNERQLRIGEGQHRCKDGSLIDVEVNVSRIEVNGNDVLLAVIHDISERKRLETQLRRAKRLETIGTLAGGIAHDFNNILAPVLGYTEMALQELEDSDPMHHDLEQVLRGAQRAKDLVKQILLFSSQSERVREPLALQKIIKETVALLGTTIPEAISVEQQIDPGCGNVRADAAQIHQVVLNLCTNAWHAMEPEGGILTIALNPTKVDRTTAKLHPNLQTDQEYARISITDTGPGVADSTAERIFEPYFTTKTVGKGSGLGLSVVHGIVRRHEGEILIQSEPGQGTAFHVYLPLESASGGTTEPESGGVSRVRNTGKRGVG